MSDSLSFVMTISLTGAVAGFVWLALRNHSPRVWVIACTVLIVCAAVWYAFQSSTRADDGSMSVEEIAAVFFCYGAMLLGMTAEYIYAQADRGKRKLKFEPLTMLMPILVSPIVFIPMLTIAGDVATRGAFTRAQLMVYLVAFQNGFFWKGFFQQLRQKMTQAPGEARS